MKLSILIPTLPGREQFLDKTLKALGTHPQVEIVTDHRGREISTGRKRNDLIQKSKGEYFCFVDDDDEIPTYYISEMLDALVQDPDVVTFIGYMTEFGRTRHFTIKLGEKYEERNGHIYRFPNHLCAFRKSLVHHIKFPDLWTNEDYRWAKAVNDAGVLKTEYHIQKNMYIYHSVPNKKY